MSFQDDHRSKEVSRKYQEKETGQLVRTNYELITEKGRKILVGLKKKSKASRKNKNLGT